MTSWTVGCFRWASLWLPSILPQERYPRSTFCWTQSPTSQSNHLTGAQFSYPETWSSWITLLLMTQKNSQNQHEQVFGPEWIDFDVLIHRDKYLSFLPVLSATCCSPSLASIMNECEMYSLVHSYEWLIPVRWMKSGEVQNDIWWLMEEKGMK